MKHKAGIRRLVIGLMATVVGGLTTVVVAQPAQAAMCMVDCFDEDGGWQGGGGLGGSGDSGDGPGGSDGGRVGGGGYAGFNPDSTAPDGTGWSDPDASIPYPEPDPIDPFVVFKAVPFGPC